jgi:hypothetical protein
MAQSPSGPLNSRLGKYYVRLRIGEYKRPTPFSTSKFQSLETIYLPLPTELRDSTAVGYNSNDNLESVGDLFNGDLVSGLGALGLRNIGSVINDTAKTALQAKLDTLSNFGGGKLAEAAGKAIDQVTNPAQLTSAIQQSVGMAPNPNPSVTFTGPNLNQFNLSWTIYPKSASESEGLLEVIKILKRSALPENTISGASAILNYPRMVQINYFPWDSGSEDSWGWTKNSIIKHKKCVMTRVDVSYTPGGAPGFFHETNGPVAATILISFQEIEYMLSQDWEGDDGFGLADALKFLVSSIVNIAALPITAPIDAVNAVGNGIGEVGTGVGEAGVAVAQGASESRAAQLAKATLGKNKS